MPHSEAILVHAAHRRDADLRVPLFECKHCHRQTSVTAGTIFHKNKTPLYKWFLAIYLVSHDKRDVSAKHFSVTSPFRTTRLGTCFTKSVLLWRNEIRNIRWKELFKSMTSTLAAKAKVNGDVALHSRPWSWGFH
jgi:hypothetical protein